MEQNLTPLQYNTDILYVIVRLSYDEYGKRVWLDMLSNPDRNLMVNIFVTEPSFADRLDTIKLIERVITKTDHEIKL